MFILLFLIHLIILNIIFGDEDSLILINMAIPMNISPMPLFDPNGDPASVSQRWEKWCKSFDIYVGAAGVADDVQKRQLFLHSVGPEVQDIFFTLAETGKDFTTAKKKLTEYFLPRQNVSFNRHLFRKCKQNEDESVIQLVTKLHLEKLLYRTLLEIN